MSFEKELKKADKIAINCRIDSYKLRNKQLVIFKEANDHHIKSLAFKLKDDLEKSDFHKKEALRLREEAKVLGSEAECLSARASKLSRSYNAILDMLDENWKSLIDLRHDNAEG